MPEKIIQPGIYADMSDKDYFGDPCPTPSLTQSIAKILIERSPAHAKLEHPRLTLAAAPDDAEKYDAARAIGNATHALLIGRGKKIVEAKFSDWRSKDAQAFRAEHEATGNVAILSKHLTRALEMVDAVTGQIAAAGWSDCFQTGQGECVMAWREGDLWFRTMIDWYTPTVCYDLKTAGMSVAPHVLPMKMVNDGWDIQAAMHERALKALDPAGSYKFRFIAVENEPPYALVPVEMSDAWLTMGRKKLERAVSIWSSCMATGVWPGYPSEVLRPEYPGYAEARWLEREVYEAARERMPQSQSRPPFNPDVSLAG